jgi:drug/metabolite transporter (DMT)-like permease
MLLLPVVLGIFLAFCFGTSDYLSKKIIMDVGPYRTTVYVLATSGVGVLLPALALTSSLAVTASLLALLLLVSVSTFAAFFFMYRGYQRGLLSLISPTVNAYPIFTIAISLLVIRVTLSSAALEALVMVIAGIILVSTSFSDLFKGLSNGRTKLTPGIGSAVLAAFLFAVAWTSFGVANQRLGYLLPAIFVRGVAASVGFAAAPALKQNVRPPPRRQLPRLLAMASLEAAGLASFSLGILVYSSSGAIPILSTFGGMGVAFTVVYAVALLKERLELNHVLGIALLIAGVAALLYFTG